MDLPSPSVGEGVGNTKSKDDDWEGSREFEQFKGIIDCLIFTVTDQWTWAQKKLYINNYLKYMC